MTLTAEELSFSVGKRALINKVSLHIEEGEKVGLIGPNGSGKSTLLRLLSGLTEPTHGRVLLENQSLDQYSRRDLAQLMSFVQQKASTEERIRAEDAVALGRTPWLKPFERWDKNHQHYVVDAFEQVDMWHKHDQLWHTLSGGEQQRLHIARALAQNTPLIIMDEPTNHLDIKNQLVVLSLLKRIKRTMVLALHDLNHALHCDRLIALKHGNIVAEGSPKELITPAFIEDIFDVKARIIEDEHFPTAIQLLS